MRVRRVLVTSGVLVSLLGSALAGSSTGTAGVASTWCSDGAPTPCVESMAVDGTPVDHATSPWSVSFFTVTGGPSGEIDYNVTKNGSYQLDPSDVSRRVAVTFDMGTLKPRVIWGWAHDGATARTTDPGGSTYHVTVVANPVERLRACRYDTCPYTGQPGDTEYMLQGLISDASWWGSTSADHDQLSGFDYFTNVDIVSMPPDISTDSSGAMTMSVLMKNAHDRADHTTYFGEGQMRIPNPMLRDVYGIPDPGTMTSSSLSGVLTGGSTGDITITPGTASMLVDISHVTFPLVTPKTAVARTRARALKVRAGTIVPTRPSHVSGRRTAVHRARLSFEASHPRGARPTGYEVRCSARGARDVILTRDHSSPVVVTGLRPGIGYDCRVRARSKAGPGPWSASVRVARHA